MKKFFKRFLCIVGFAVLTSVCAHAGTTLLLVDNLTAGAIPLVEDKKDIQVTRSDQGGDDAILRARVILFNKYWRCVVLAVDDDSERFGQESQASYWLRSSVLPLNREALYVREKQFDGSVINGYLGLCTSIVRIESASENGGAAYVSPSLSRDSYDQRGSLTNDEDMDDDDMGGASWFSTSSLSDSHTAPGPSIPRFTESSDQPRNPPAPMYDDDSDNIDGAACASPSYSCDSSDQSRSLPCVQYNAIAGASAVPPSSLLGSPELFDQRKTVRIAVKDKDGKIYIFEISMFCDDETLTALEGGTVLSVEVLQK